MDVDVPGSGRGSLRGGVADLLKPRFGQADLFAAHGHTPRIIDGDFQRHAQELLLPVARLDHQTDADLVAGTIDATVREQVRGQALRLLAVGHAVDGKAREVQVAVLAQPRQKRGVAGFAHQVQERRFLAHKVGQLGQRDVAVGPGAVRGDGEAVFADDLDVGALDRLAGA